ncbi:MAG: hypothetical protein SH856_04545 [Flavobacteriales bacterium]|nr:hypothetical protein [Flavobacteriales bacterium]
MKRTSLIVICCFLLARFNAQVASDYFFSSGIETYTSINTGTVLFTGTINDNVSSTITIPSFYYDGALHTSMRVSSNGFIVLGGTTPSSTMYTPLSASGTALSTPGVISAFGANIENSDAGSSEIRWANTGTEIVIQWKDMHRFNTTTSIERFSFQIRLDLTDGDIRFVYDGPVDVGLSQTQSPQVGLRGPTNVFANDVKNRDVTAANNWDTSNAGANVGATCRFSSFAPPTFPMAGLTYLWTTSACFPPLGITLSNYTSSTVDISWTASAGAVSYDWEVVPGGNAQGAGVIASGNTAATTATASGISGVQSITVFLRSNCGDTQSIYTGVSGFNCNNAIAISCNTIISTAVGSGSGVYDFPGTFPNNSCGAATPGRETAFLFTATTTGPHYIDQNASPGTVHYLYKEFSGDCSGTGWTCIDNLNGNVTSTPAVTLIEGTTYYIMADAETSTGGTLTFQVYCPGPPPCVTNPNTPANAAQICSTTSTNLSWTAAFTANNYDVFFSTDNPPIILVSDNQAATTYTATGLIAGLTYYWQVVPQNAYGIADACSIWSFTIIEIILGDTQTNPIIIATIPTSIAGSNTGCFTNNYVGTESQPSADVYYQITTNPCTDQITIGTCVSSFDTYIHFLSATGTHLDSDDDACPFFPNNNAGSILTYNVNPSTVYIIVVEGYLTNTGNYTLSITETSLGTVGCTDPLACNYTAGAGCDNGTCLYDGCTDATACNYSENNGCDDGSCVYPGCTDPLATNYDEDAGCDDGSCVLYTCAGDFDLNGLVNINDLLPFMANFGCAADCGYYDLDANGSVGVTDLLSLMAYFATYCP